MTISLKTGPKGPDVFPVTEQAVTGQAVIGQAVIGRTSYGSLPARMKVLYITTLNRTGGWLAEAFATDSASQIVLEEVVGGTAGLARLRDEVFDAVLVSHEPGVLDALDLIEGMRAGGNEEPMIILGTEAAHQIDALCYEVGANDYCCVAETTVRGLLWKFARAIGHYKIVRENRRLVQAERQRLQQEHHEAERLLDQQRALIVDLDVLRMESRTPASSDTTQVAGPKPAAPVEGGPETLFKGTEGVDSPRHPTRPGAAHAMSESSDPPLELHEPLVAHYRELLRAYVIMGVGNLSDEMSRLARLLADSGMSAQKTMRLHVQVLEELVQGLGNRSARHVMSRADLLVLEVMGHLADGYRQRYHARHSPPRQLMLPGFEAFGLDTSRCDTSHTFEGQIAEGESPLQPAA